MGELGREGGREGYLLLVPKPIRSLSLLQDLIEGDRGSIHGEGEMVLVTEDGHE
jgi:hypothetical protein